ncbi:ribonuclease P 40kDa subunit-domain-containing protein [Dendryphion nanum]|uniref:Ribonuclease P 40kDa subunit-domain-containing protein n=1 Tax=Dendryphion nanum TaxID=256645 RepID=A0A9P9D1Q5_9PLEO|nr:ribonuclease P 40kDa subunit-domain-containing protein [Dendryphion nanum]
MLDIHKSTTPTSKCYFTHSLLPSYLDPSNLSRKKKPFNTINAQPFTHTLDLILPSEIHALVRDTLLQHRLHYARVHLSLLDILSGDFFSTYIKQGNIMLLSEGRRGIDNVFEYHDGMLRMELDRVTYERCGIQGVPVEDGGRKHRKERFRIETDLGAKSAVHGKKGFGRLEWAARNVLVGSWTWLLFNCVNGAGLGDKGTCDWDWESEPVAAHAPVLRHVDVEEQSLGEVKVPGLRVGDLEGLYKRSLDDGAAAMELLECLDMLALDSPRMHVDDRVDPFVSRYEVPVFETANGTFREPVAREMMRVRWRGLISPQFARQVFLVVRREGLRVGKESSDGEGGTLDREEGRWFGLSARAFAAGVGSGDGYTVMQWAGRDTLCWEMED